MRAVVEIIQEVKAAVGQDISLGIRLCCMELLDDVRGNTPEESIEPVHGSGGRSIKLPPSFGPSILILFPFRSIYYEKISPFLSIECEK
jgi:hypothetical protein